MEGINMNLDVAWMEEMMLGWVEWGMKVPLLKHALQYLASSLHHDPWRLFLEFAMLVFFIRYLLGRRYSPKEPQVTLSRKEVDELVEEWSPEPLVALDPAREPAFQRERAAAHVITSPIAHTVRLQGHPHTDFVNLVSCNTLSLLSEPKVEAVAQETLKAYGVGSCGPPGFYGTLDVHMALEKKIAEFLGTQEAILYSFAFSAVASVIPAFAKRGDILICDEAVSFPLQKGIQISRSQVKYFKHNDMEDLERILRATVQEEEKKKRKLTRRFIISEGLFQNHGDICDLPKLVELKKKYKFRLMVDEAFSLGNLGKTGKGVCEHFGIPATEVDFLTGSLSNTVGASGGYCAGSTVVVDHQRLSGSSYCFSASMPALLAASAVKSLEIIESEPERLNRLRKNISLFKKLLQGKPGLTVSGSDLSPILFLGLEQPFPSREKNEQILEEIVQECIGQGIFVQRARYVAEEELKLPPPSIRISLSEGHSQAQLEQSASALATAFAGARSRHSS